MLALMVSSCGSTESARRLAPMTATEIMQRVYDQSQTIETLEADGNLTIESPANSGSAGIDLQLLRPDSVWLRLSGPFGISVGTLMLSRQKFIYFDALNHRRLTGRPDPSTLESVFHIGLSFDEILDAFAGNLGTLRNAETNSEVTASDGQYVLRSQTDTGSEQRWVDGTSFIVTKFAQFDTTGRPVVTGEASLIESVDSTVMPHRIRVILHRQRQSLTIAYRTVRINSNRQMQFTLPDATSEIRLGSPIR